VVVADFGVPTTHDPAQSDGLHRIRDEQVLGADSVCFLAVEGDEGLAVHRATHDDGGLAVRALAP
jgi:hypothetical protein